MNALRTIFARLRALFRAAEAEDRMNEEFAFHLEMERDRLIAEGLPPEEAIRRASIAFGGMEGHREVMREERTLAALENTVRDFRFASRSLRRTPASTAMAIIAMGLGIGAATTVFALVNWILLRPVPGVTDPGRVAMIRMTTETSETGVSLENLIDLREMTNGFESIAGQTTSSLYMVADGVEYPELAVDVVGGDYFGTLGVTPHIGRFFATDEYDAIDPRRVAVISRDLWTTVFASDTGVIGKVVELNGSDFTIIGVAPRGFQGIYRMGGIDVWTPISTYGLIRRAPTLAPGDRRRSTLNLFGRMSEGLTPAVVQEQFTAAMDVLIERYPDENEVYQSFPALVVPGIGLGHRTIEHVENVSRLVLMLGGALLLISYANASNVVLIRGLKRRGESAIRSALGASAGRLLRANIAEGIVLATMACGIGLVFAFGATRLLRGETILRLPQFDGLTFDWRVLGVASAIALLCGVLFGLLPSLIRRTSTPGGDLRHSSRSVTSAGGLLRTTLSTVQIAGSIVLVIGSLLLLQSLRNLVRVDVGFEPERVQVFAVDPQNLGYSWEEINQLRDQLLERAQALPGVESASVLSSTPFSGGYFVHRVAPIEYPDQELVSAFAPSATPDYLRTLGIPLLQGETISPDHPDGVVISRSLALRLFGEQAAIGRQVTDRRSTPTVYTIVGVMDDIRMTNLRGEPNLVIFRPMSELSSFETQSVLLVRSRFDHATTERAILEILAGIDSSLTIYRTELLSETVARTIGEERMVTRLMGALTLLALLLAAVGVYSVASFGVAQRTRELGIRMALGARSVSIARLVLRGSVTMAIVGMLAGAIGAAWATRILESMLFEVERLDPGVFAIAAVAIAAVSVGATLLPARTAVRLDPMESIRAD